MVDTILLPRILDFFHERKGHVEPGRRGVVILVGVVECIKIWSFARLSIGGINC
jgi:hypothetical protein